MIVFAGMELPEAAKDCCKALQEQLRLKATGSFVRRENFHVTLAYFGDVGETKLNKIKTVFSRHPFPKSELELNRLSSFNGFKGDQIVFLADAQESLIAYRNALTEDWKKEAIAIDEKPFTPHVTLVRAKQKHVPLNDISVTPVTMEAGQIVLFHAYSHAGMRIYDPIFTINASEEDQ